MGMFDTIVYAESDCFVCGEPVTNYQSKDGDCELQTLTPEQLLAQSEENETSFYGYCHDDDWNNGDPHHQNLFVIVPPQPLTIKRKGEPTHE